MVGKEEVTDIKLTFLERMVLKKSVIKFLITLQRGPHTARELKNLGVKPPDKISYILYLVKKDQREDGIMVYSLTERGQHLAQALSELIRVTGEILPSED